MFYGPPVKKLWKLEDLSEQEELFGKMLNNQFPTDYRITCEQGHDTVKWVCRGRNKKLGLYNYAPAAIFPGSDVCFVCGSFEHRFFTNYGYLRENDEGLLPETEDWEREILAWAIDLGYPWGYEQPKE